MKELFEEAADIFGSKQNAAIVFAACVQATYNQGNYTFEQDARVAIGFFKEIVTQVTKAESQ